MEAQILSAVLSAVAGQIAALFTGPIVAPIRQWLCYPFEYDKNMETMEKQLVMLQETIASVRNSVESARNNGEEIEDRVTTWLTKADETIEEATKVLRVEGRVCLNLMLRHQPSREAKKITQVIDEILENGRFEKFSFRPATQGIVTRSYKNYMDFESRMSTVKGLMEALGDANMNVIGMWGMAGVGKTTLARVVARQAKEEKLFEEVAMADVTQSPDLKRIQKEIAEMLDLKFDKKTVSGRASRLHERLSQDRKILVILDDIWEKLELETIGIPSKGCKLVLISRNRDVLVCEMDTQKDFGLEVLPKEEAWHLFENMAGDCVKDSNLRCVATETCS
ncbi:hypothetical protein FH972_019906 [Carpinus fangiana]|uniref:NB-ARC domain-containing protein n=1 Tax=Carpinus fangiana TaxID=176857 RepID=A0A5N6RTT2_9ROSI|nr:hypothetical protein FH972_019906 [Carpinus fangiana]